jgi:hypothetical protein
LEKPTVPQDDSILRVALCFLPPRSLPYLHRHLGSVASSLSLQGNLYDSLALYPFPALVSCWSSGLRWRKGSPTMVFWAQGVHGSHGSSLEMY